MLLYFRFSGAFLYFRFSGGMRFCISGLAMRFCISGLLVYFCIFGLAMSFNGVFFCISEEEQLSLQVAHDGVNVVVRTQGDVGVNPQVTGNDIQPCHS